MLPVTHVPTDAILVQCCHQLVIVLNLCRQYLMCSNPQYGSEYYYNKIIFNIPSECVFLHRAVQRRRIRTVQPGLRGVRPDPHTRGMARRRIRAQNSCRIHNYQSVSLYRIV